MTTAAFIPEIWSARFLSRLFERLVYGNLTNRNYQGAISSVGNKVKIPTPSTTITVRDYAVGSDIATAETTTGSTIELDINKQKYFHYLVDDIDQVQESPDQMDDAMRVASFEMSKQVDTDIRTEMNTAFATTRRIAQQTQHPDALDKTFGDNFIRNIAKLKRTMSEANLPAEGRWLIVNPHIQEGLDKYFLLVNPQGVYLPATQEQTLRNGFAGNILGFNLYVANTVPDGAAVASKATYRLYAGQGREAVSFAQQITETIAYRPEKRFADAVKSLMVYGVKTVLPARLYTLEVQKAA